jgi:hypothetical protein
MSEDGQSGDSWAFSESRDWLEGRHSNESDLPPHPGEISDRKARRTLTSMYQAYERAARDGRVRSGPSDLTESSDWSELREFFGAEALADAVAHGEPARIRHMVGSREDEPDLSGIRTLETVISQLTRAAAMFYLFGRPGSGKTMFACLMAELWKREHPNGLVASNIRTLDRADWINAWPDLDEWMKEDEETVLAGDQTPKLYLLDEGSSVASGRGSQGYEAATKLARLVYKIRKYGGSLIIVGHDGKDVAPSVRELCTIVEKVSEKRARFYDDVREREGRNPVTPELAGIPLPDQSWQPNTYDVADFYWSRVGEDEPEPGEAARDSALYTVIKAKEDGLTNRETAQFVPFSQGWVGERWREYRDHDQHTQVLSNVEDMTA